MSITHYAADIDEGTLALAGVLTLEENRGTGHRRIVVGAKDLFEELRDLGIRGKQVSVTVKRLES